MKIKSFNQWRIYEKETASDKSTDPDEKILSVDGDSDTGSTDSTATDAAPAPVAKKPWEYSKPAGIEIADDMKLTESALRAFVKGEVIPAGNLFNYGDISPINFETWAAKNSMYSADALITGKAEELAKVAADCLSKKLVINAPSTKGDNAYITIEPVDATGTSWKMVSIKNPKIGNVVMTFNDIVYVPCSLTSKEKEEHIKDAGGVNQMGVWKNDKKSHNFKEGDIVYLQVSSTHPKAESISKLYTVSQRSMDKSTDTYKNYYGGGDKIASKDFLQLNAGYPGDAATESCFGMAILVKRGKKSGGGTTRPVRQAVTKYF